MRLKIDVVEQGLVGMIDDITKKHVPFALALALTKTAQAAKPVVQKEMESVFDRPTPQTLNSVRVIPATKSRLYADVTLKDENPKGTPPSKYLQPEIEGGPRRLKRSERALASRGILPSGMETVPGPAVDLDPYGNIKGGTWVRILSALSSLEGAAASLAQGQTKKRRSRNPYNGALFVVQRRQLIAGKMRAPGIYQRTEQGFRLLILFIGHATYKRRFHFQDIVAQVFEQTIVDNLKAAMAQAIATAK